MHGLRFFIAAPVCALMLLAMLSVIAPCYAAASGDQVSANFNSPNISNNAQSKEARTQNKAATAPSKVNRAQNKRAEELSNTEVLQLYRQATQIEATPNHTLSATTNILETATSSQLATADTKQANQASNVHNKKVTNSNQALSLQDKEGDVHQALLLQASLAVQKLTSAAAYGNALAQLSLGNLYLSGHGVPQDHKQAFKWIQAAAQQGNAQAQNNLGVM